MNEPFYSLFLVCVLTTKKTNKPKLDNFKELCDRLHAIKERKSILNQEGDSSSERSGSFLDSGKPQNYFGSAKCFQELVPAMNPLLPTI